jgi:SagB-type dehydrogenase family enzyme
MKTDAQAVFAYHQRSKHLPNAYAKGPASLDWDDQPNPFRRFQGCAEIPLPTPGAEPHCRFADLDQPQNIAAQDLNLHSIGLMLELAFGLSAWKQFGPDRWALRCNPSSGNLHPTEAYLLCLNAELLPPGLYHYYSLNHCLQQRCVYQPAVVSDEIYIALSSVHWRESWKYGERAFRYCQHDSGHALAALSYAAACLGWRVELLDEVADQDLARWLGLDREADFIAREPETPELICRIQVGALPSESGVVFNRAELPTQAQWFGQAQILSPFHIYRWPIIDEMVLHTAKALTHKTRQTLAVGALPPLANPINAGALIRQRRSAQQFDAHAPALPLSHFRRILSALQPSAKPPFTAWNRPARVHLALFVHRVQDLKPGLYFMPRDSAGVERFKNAFCADFLWQETDLGLPLYYLLEGSYTQAAKNLSCHQNIAGDSSFSLGMLCEFADTVNAAPWQYRHLFWECGLLGQILYLEAEAAAVRGTGIGCFFDDLMHGVLGLHDQHWQSLYHFTVGPPLQDQRLQTLPAYQHLSDKP